MEIDLNLVETGLSIGGYVIAAVTGYIGLKYRKILKLIHSAALYEVTARKDGKMTDKEKAKSYDNIVRIVKSVRGLMEK